MNRFIISISLLSSGILASAAVLSPDEALQRLGKTDTNRSLSMESPQLVYSATGSTGVTSYIFNLTSQGYLILSADDCAIPLLGYSENGQFDIESAPCSMLCWLEFYSRQIDEARNSGIYYDVSADNNTSTRQPLDPAIKTKWGQSAPYNDLCPNNGDNKCVTGCVATSMAQVLNLYSYPTVGFGIHSYIWEHLENSNKVDTELSFDYSGTKFDWENMLDVYDENYTELQANAVSQLMLACGISVDMRYGTSASGTPAQFIPYALWQYFGYDPNIRCIERDCFKEIDKSWDDLVYEQLKEHGAVIYNGVTSANEGHSFVCDGYLDNGYFHFNWGWNGLSDGWFRLDALNPEMQGTGGSTSKLAFNYQQNIVAYMDSSSQGDKDSFLPAIYGNDNFNVINSNIACGSKFSVSGNILNPTQIDYNIKFGCMLTDSESGTEGEIISITDFDLPTVTSKKLFSKAVFPTDIEEGIYCMRPVITWDGLGYWWTLPWNVKKDHVWLQVKEGMVYFNIDPETAGVSTVIDPEPASVAYYTLQGVRIAEPIQGQTCIRVSESGATKIIY